jgi:hypothetical protein
MGQPERAWRRRVSGAASGEVGNAIEANEAAVTIVSGGYVRGGGTAKPSARGRDTETDDLA